MLAVGLATLAKQDNPPAQGHNVIVVMTDDMRLDDLQFMPHTLHLLADRGVTFTQAISPYPLCCPARAELMTGQYSHNNGVQGNAWPRGGYYKLDSSNTLATWLHDQGYETAFLGKYLNQYGMRDEHEVPPGWDLWKGAPKGVYRYYDVTLNQNGHLQSYPRIYQTYLYDHIGRQMVEHESGSDRPYFMWLSYVAPHKTPITPPHTRYHHGRWYAPPPAKPDRGTFAGLPPITNPSFNEADMSDKGRFMRQLPRLTPHRVAVAHQTRIKRIEALQSVDRAVSHLVADLKRLHEYDDTYLIFISDNGMQLGEHRWRGKILGYDESVRVPLIMAGPGIPHGVVRHQAVTTVDVTTTIADMTNTTPTLKQDGESLLPLATGQKPDTGNRVVPLEAGPLDNTSKGWLYQGVRSDRYTLLRWGDGEVELYDRKKDRYEVSSVADDPAYRKVKRRMLRYLHRLDHCAGKACMAWYGMAPRGQ